MDTTVPPCVTLEQLHRAYAATGFRPLQADWIDLGGRRACGLSVLLVEQFGAVCAAAALGARMLGDYLAGHPAATVLGLPPAYVHGYAVGFDGDEPPETHVLLSGPGSYHGDLDAVAHYYRGYVHGRDHARALGLPVLELDAATVEHVELVGLIRDDDAVDWQTGEAEPVSARDDYDDDLEPNPNDLPY